MELITLFSSLIIVCGTVLMAVSLLRFKPAIKMLAQVSIDEYSRVRGLFRIHMTLMIFFILAYMVMTYIIVAEIDLVSELLIGIILFFGSVFVFLGITLHSKMIASIKKRYDWAVNTSHTLQKERTILSGLNKTLVEEVEERKRAESALEQSKYFLQTIIDALPEQLMVIDADYRIVLANRPAMAMAKLDPGFSGLHCYEMSHGRKEPCSGLDHPCPLKLIFETGKSVAVEHVHLDANGKEVNIEISATPVFNESNEAIQVIESCRDITERKRVQEKILESERKYRTILENMEEGYFEIDLSGSFTFFNHALCKIMGYEKKELLGMNNREYTSQRASRKVFKIFNNIYTTGKTSLITNYEVIAKSGEIKLLEVSASLMNNRDGQPIGFRGVVRDGTKLELAQNALRDREEWYKKLSSVTIEGICFNDNGVAIDVNDSFVTMFGYQRSELIGKNTIDMLFPSDSRKVVSDHLTSTDASPYEVLARRKDGTIFPVEILGKNTFYKGKEIRVASLRDITERKKTEERFSQMQKMEAMGTLAGGIAHDFNNILSAIMGYTEISLVESSNDNGTRERLKRVLQASHRAKDLVKQILAFSRQEEQDLKPVQVRIIVKEALKLLRASIPSTIEFREYIQKDSGTIMADPGKIHQVMMNLCTNASHAMMENGGVLEVRLENYSVPKDTKRQTPDMDRKDYVKLTVSDTGHGMDRNISKRIFEPYFTTKDPEIGTGLGLSVVHGIAKGLGGTIQVNSQPGLGTTFEVYFPRMEMGDYHNTESVERLTTGSDRILLVDDDEIVIEMTSEMLKSLGYIVDARLSSQEALKAFRHHPERFDLVITDQTMPKMTGQKLAGELKSIRPDIPIILCTGFSESMSREKSEMLGIDCYLLKPVVMVDLANAIRKVIEK